MPLRVANETKIGSTTRLVAYKSILLFGAPGAGKGTQGKILGSIPGFFHCACGDVFRAVDIHSQYGKIFLQYSSKGQLVPDDTTIGLWLSHMENMVKMGRFKPESDCLVLDGIPRNIHQAKMLTEKLDVRRVLHLKCLDKAEVYERMKRRALKENRLDDINDHVIERRLQVYEEETKPVLNFYGEKLVSYINASQEPYRVLRDLLTQIEQTCQKQPAKN